MRGSATYIVVLLGVPTKDQRAAAGKRPAYDLRVWQHAPLILGAVYLLYAKASGDL